MTRYKCVECGRSSESSENCAVCGGKMVPAGAPKKAKPKKDNKFTGDSDLGKESPGDFSPVAVRAIKPKVVNRTVLDIGRQDKRSKRQKLKTAGFIVLTIAIAALLAFSIRYFFGDYNVKFSDKNVEKRQEQVQENRE